MINLPKILVLDNNDSFTYNLVQMFVNCGSMVSVHSSDTIEPEIAGHFDGIVLSPGPGLPSDFPLMNTVIESYHQTKPILGVCLGHQALAEFFGGELYRLNKVRHGIKSEIIISDDIIYKGLNKPVFVGRYHSWAVKVPLPECLSVTSVSTDGVLMSFRHNHYNIRGIQYHPESIISDKGIVIIKNWIDNISCKS
ncbi:MAG: aminodeoxychorismate/anthranilate synthase component II [Candidatus Kapabacteria bacterium]|nr:aminodeoxychorismate/anthranilate synthase component II [Candidatus Kapabacteria bacterium]